MRHRRASCSHTSPRRALSKATPVSRAPGRAWCTPPPRSTEPEDHLGGLLEVMRVLVAGGAGRCAAPIAEQKRFFEEHVAPGGARFFEALARAPESNYYRRVAALGTAFVALESQSFQLD